MFTAVDVETGEDIIILAPSWEPRLKELRRWGKRGRLVCPECRQPVRVRAGKQRRRHFAHVHKADCDYGNDNPVVVKARAVLYRWLVGKFGEEAVSLERRLKEAALPRPVDLWVSREKGDLAYWIFGKEVRPAVRKALKAVFFPEEGDPPAVINWLFVHDMLRADPDDPSVINLTTTERAFLASSTYDVTAYPFSPTLIDSAGKTLHYLDVAEETLTTYRGLKLRHEPGTYVGRPVSNPLDNVLAAPDNGEFVHPGEHEQLQQLRAKQWQQGGDQGDQTGNLAEAVGSLQGFLGRSGTPNESFNVPSKDRQAKWEEQDKIVAEQLERLRSDPEYRAEWFRKLRLEGKS